jgi:hypothetical protein
MKSTKPNTSNAGDPRLAFIGEPGPGIHLHTTTPGAPFLPGRSADAQFPGLLLRGLSRYALDPGHGPTDRVPAGRRRSGGAPLSGMAPAPYRRISTGPHPESANPDTSSTIAALVIKLPYFIGFLLQSSSDKADGSRLAARWLCLEPLVTRLQLRPATTVQPRRSRVGRMRWLGSHFHYTTTSRSTRCQGAISLPDTRIYVNERVCACRRRTKAPSSLRISSMSPASKHLRIRSLSFDTRHRRAGLCRQLQRLMRLDSS